MKNLRVAASLILYNSSPNSLTKLDTYRTQVERVYVIDNSDRPDDALVQTLTRLPNIHYIANQGNQGVAHALNRAASVAIVDGFDYLLTMDDDTELPPDAVRTMLAFLANNPAADTIGILSGVHTESTPDVPVRAVSYTMTSGNLLNLSVYPIVGPFRDALFIDHVDHEYGLRLNRAGYQVLELPGLWLRHRLGERKASGWGNYTFISHTPIRVYYNVRNGWTVARAFPEFRRQATVLIGKEWLKALFFEDRKRERLRLLWRGTVDAWRGRLGKLAG